MIHPSAVVDDGAVIGAGTNIWHFTHVSSGAVLGRDCRLGQNVFIARGVIVGDNVKIQNNVSVYEGVTLENDVFCGPSMVFTNVSVPRSAFPKGGVYERTLVRRGATLGANSTIVCGITIGEHAFVGAGSVVTKDVPDFALVFGNPARLRGWRCPCGGSVADGACPDCGARFRLDGDKLVRA